MAMFCNNCGAEMSDDAKVCGTCGAPVPAQEAPKANKFSVDKKLMPAIVAIVLVIAIVLGLAVFGKGYEKALDNYYAVKYLCKISKLDDLAPKAYWQYLEEEADMSFDDLKDEYEDELDDLKDSMEDRFGKNIRVSIKVTDKHKLSKKKMEGIAESLNDKYDIPEKSVKKGFDLEYDLLVKGSEDDYRVKEQKATVVKIGGGWYCVSYSMNSDGEYQASLNVL
jgi:hypothetical protein